MLTSKFVRYAKYKFKGLGHALYPSLYDTKIQNVSYSFKSFRPLDLLIYSSA